MMQLFYAARQKLHFLIGFQTHYRNFLYLQ